jgi:hypothetical protein
MTKSTDVFQSARLKVERANLHISELQATIDAFCDTPFYEIVVYDEPGNGSGVVIEPRRPVPAVLTLIIGDAIHNLRTALDHVATAPVRAGGGKVGKLSFPFFKTRDELIKDKDKLGPIDKFLPGARNLIIDTIQPYPDGQGCDLHAMHSLDIMDKHNQLVIITTATLAANLVIKSQGKIILSAANIKFNPQQATYLLDNSHSSNIIVEHNYKAFLEITLQEPELFKDKPVIPTLYHLSRHTTEVIERFADLI